MSDRPAVAWLSEARDHVLETQKLTEGMDQESFGSDRRTLFAVCFCFVVAGEALNQVTKDVRALAPRHHRLAEPAGACLLAR